MVHRVDREVPGKRAAQCFVGGNEDTQALNDSGDSFAVGAAES